MIPLALLGLFSQGCVNGLEKTHFFSAAESVYSERNFADAACARPSLVSRSYGRYVLGERLPVPAGATAIDFTFRRVTLEPLTAEVARGFRERALCGLSAWEKGVETEITGLACDLLDAGVDFPVPASGDLRFGVVKIGAEVFFGRLTPERPGLSPATRPRELDPLPYRPVR